MSDMDEFTNDNVSTGSTGPGKMLLPLVTIVIIAFLAGAAGGFLTVKILKPYPTQPKLDLPQNTGPKNENTKPTQTITENLDKGDSQTNPKNPGLLTLESFTTNLNDPFGKKYIEVELKLLLNRKDLVDKITKNDLLITTIRHEIHMILSAKSYNDLKSTAGKLALFDEIMLRSNEMIKEVMGVEPIIKVFHTVWKIE